MRVMVHLERSAEDSNAGTEPMWNAKGQILIPDVASDIVRFRIKNNNWGKK